MTRRVACPPATVTPMPMPDGAPECKDPCITEWGTMCTEPAGHTGWHRNHRTNARWVESGRPTQSPSEPPAAALHLPGPGAVYRALLRHQAGRALGRCSAALRSAADALTRLRWRLEDSTARNQAVRARHPSAQPRLTAVPPPEETP